MMIENENLYERMAKELNCEVCHNTYTDDEIITVHGIWQLKLASKFPWYICIMCAKKISDALATRSDGDAKLRTR
jgi:hypothetical protein